MFKKIIFFGFLLILPLTHVSAQEEVTQGNEVDIYFFWAVGCPHCEDEKPFLEALSGEFDYVTVHDFEVTENKDNIDLLKKIGKELMVNVSGVPFTVVGDEYFIGWQSADTTGQAISRQVQEMHENGGENVVGSICSDCSNVGNVEHEEDAQPVKLPFFGTVDAGTYSLGAITVLIAAADGFNPCAMWVLIFLITLLLGLNDRKKMWILGTAFIVTSAFVYFLFMVAWLNVIDFLNYVPWIRFVIGVLAVVLGIRSINEYVTNPAGTCKVTTGNKQQRIFEKLKDVVQKKSFILSLIGIIVLAFVVNLVELVCSAGLPAVYTQLLVQNDLSTAGYYGYILLYIFIFMLDDLFVFIMAMTTLKLTGLSGKYTRIAQLIGGVVMLIIGILMILRPDWLMFG